MKSYTNVKTLKINIVKEKGKIKTILYQPILLEGNYGYISPFSPKDWNWDLKNNTLTLIPKKRKRVKMKEIEND